MAEIERTTTRSFRNVVVVLASLIIIFIGIRYMRGLLTPILLAALATMLLLPIYAWLRQRVPAWLALLATLGLLLGGGLLLLWAVSSALTRLVSQLGVYAEQFDGRMERLPQIFDAIPSLTSFISALDLNVGLVTRVASTAVALVIQVLMMLLLVALLIAESDSLRTRLTGLAGMDSPLVMRINRLMTGVVRQFAARAGQSDQLDGVHGVAADPAG